MASFVRRDVIPQLADGVEVLTAIDLPATVSKMVLIPNSKGLDRALAVRDLFDEAALFVSASQTHNGKNVNRTVEQTMADVKVMGKRIRAEGLTFCAVIATAFGCPYEGRVPQERVLGLAEEFAAAGATEIGFGDTTGMANPAQVARFFAAARQRLPQVELTAHFHNTRGQGLANAYAALEAGCASFEASFGELGGCPVPAGSTGNIATEDLVSMFHEMGIETGLDLQKVIDAARRAQAVLGRKLTSHSIVAGRSSGPRTHWRFRNEQPRRIRHRGRAGHRAGHRHRSGRRRLPGGGRRPEPGDRHPDRQETSPRRAAPPSPSRST